MLHNEDFCLGTLNLRMLALPGFLPSLPKLWFFLAAGEWLGVSRCTHCLGQHRGWGRKLMALCSVLFCSVRVCGS